MAVIMNIAVAFDLLSVIALLLLIYVYYKNFRKIKSKFTIGLMIFALLLLAQNAVSLYFHFTMMQYYVPEVELFECFFTVVQTIAYFVLLKITWE